MAGPLEGVKVVELAGIGPTPFCAMMLADMGAQVLRIERPQARGGVERGGHRFDVLLRGRDRMLLNLREPTATGVVLELLKSADVLLEGYRPGVMERLGLGPDVCLARRPSLVYARMTGWGQTGPLSAAAGHDINYIAISGALHAIGRRGQAPVAPPGFIGDMGGGGMMMAFGIACGILAARRTGTGQAIDAAISDGAALLGSAFFGMRAGGRWSAERGENVIDGGAHFYDSYCCADGKYVSVGALEPQFYALLLERCGITDPEFQNQMDAATWPRLKERMAALFSTRSREQWSELLEGTDVCFAPVLDWDEAPLHPHNRARGTFVEVAGVCQPAPAPRFSSTPAAHPSASPEEPSDPRAALLAWGLDPAAVDRCLEAL
jgi:alpha-methylacyl-CoA racemase